MKKVLVIFMMMFVAGACASVQEEEYVSPYYMTEEEVKKIDEEICRLEEPVRDLDARYWAGRIVAGDVTYEELEKNSHHWFGGEECNRRLMEKIRQNLDTGNTHPLTQEEEELLERVNQAARAVIMPATQDKELIASLTAEQCIELDGRLWAWEIVHEKWITLEELKKYAATTWPCPADYNRRIIEEIEKNVKSKHIVPLNEREAYINDACTEFDCESYRENPSDK